MFNKHCFINFLHYMIKYYIHAFYTYLLKSMNLYIMYVYFLNNLYEYI